MDTLLLSLLIMFILAMIIGLSLGYLSIRLRTDNHSIADQINDLLPQTQCGQCGFPGCKPYAESIARDNTPINRCAPGGQQTIQAIANLLGCEPLPLNEDFGTTKPKSYAVIQEDQCIGCTLCIQACPVDAIIGAAKQLHIVVDTLCTGCELCIAPCPVDCISMQTVEENTQNWRRPYPVFTIKKIDG